MMKVVMKHNNHKKNEGILFLVSFPSHFFPIVDWTIQSAVYWDSRNNFVLPKNLPYIYYYFETVIVKFYIF